MVTAHAFAYARGMFVHVTQRGNRGEPIFEDDDDRAFFLSFFGRIVMRKSWSCFSYCLMSNHYHCVLRAELKSLSHGMQWLHGLYAQYFNNKYGLSGHVFAGPYRKWLIESELHMLEACRYVELNPVRAGLCEHPRDWTWSSYRALTGLAPMPPFLSTESDTRPLGAAYEAFVEEGLRRVANERMGFLARPVGAR